jgi:hypothetical protein
MYILDIYAASMGGVYIIVYARAALARVGWRRRGFARSTLHGGFNPSSLLDDLMMR